MIKDHIHELIGDTPIVKLNCFKEIDTDIYVKLEWFNPGGSVKDRIALNMIEAAEKAGQLQPGDTIIEPTSGNTGIGLAMVAASKGYKVIITMPDTLSIERQKLLKAYGAELILTDGTYGMKRAIETAKTLSDKYGYFMPMQFENKHNPEIHEKTTAQEIITEFENLDACVVGIGTGGTITGVGKMLKRQYTDIKIVAVEPVDSAVLSGNEGGKHKIQGIGAGFIPSILNTEIYDQIITISNEEAFEMARFLAKKEGLLVGISTGANVAASLKLARTSLNLNKILTFSPSNGERYLSTELY